MRLATLWILSLALWGCTEFFRPGEARTGASSSLVDYLYPEGEVPPGFEAQIPQLNLPLRVGLAFVPTREASRMYGGQPVLSEADKSRLLERVKGKFVDRKYITSIEVIPETYLRSTKGFDGMAQVARLYGVDVMALVSYDQVAAVGDNKLSLTYWTIVGAYVIKGTENEVSTFVDTAVFDVRSRKLLFRAPGVDQRQKSSTAIDSDVKLQGARLDSFGGAVDQMAQNLSTELDLFEKRLKDEPQLADVRWRTGSGGGGTGGGGGLGIELLLLVLVACRAARKS